MEEYRYECASVAGFLQRVVVLSQKGYRFFVQGEIPERRVPDEVDAKLLAKYDLRLTRRQRTYRKSLGRENGHYLRFGRTWVLMGTSRRFFLEVDAREEPRDLRERPIRAFGYTLSLRRDGSAARRGEHRLRSSVRLDDRELGELRAHFDSLAVHRAKEVLAGEFWRVTSEREPFAPVYRQLRAVLRRTNERRKEAGFEALPHSCIRERRRIPRHFAQTGNAPRLKSGSSG